jgi:hypothetical protein
LSAAVVLRECHLLARSPIIAIQSQEARNAVSRECGEIAAGVGAIAPLNAYAWFVAAEAAARLGEDEAFNRNISRSRASAPHVQWLAAARVDLTERYFSAVDDANRVGEVGDIEVLLQSDLGIAELAKHYVIFSAARDKITTIVEGQSDAAQAKFLKAVAEATIGAGS